MPIHESVSMEDTVSSSVTPTILIQRYFAQYIDNVKEEFIRDHPTPAANVVNVFVAALNMAWELLHQYPRLFTDSNVDKSKHCHQFIKQFLPDLIATERDIHARLFTVHHGSSGHPELPLSVRETRQSMFEDLLRNTWHDHSDCWVLQMLVKYNLARDYLASTTVGDNNTA